MTGQNTRSGNGTEATGFFYSLDDEEIRDFLENQCLNCHCSPYFILVRKEAYHILHEAMNTLPPVQKRRIVLRFWNRKSYSEIARQEGVDESAVRHRVKRALARLKMELIWTGVVDEDFTELCPTRYVKHFHSRKGAGDRQNKNASIINFDDGGEGSGE